MDDLDILNESSESNDCLSILIKTSCLVFVVSSLAVDSLEDILLLILLLMEFSKSSLVVVYSKNSRSTSVVSRIEISLYVFVVSVKVSSIMRVPSISVSSESSS